MAHLHRDRRERQTQAEPPPPPERREEQPGVDVVHRNRALDHDRDGADQGDGGQLEPQPATAPPLAEPCHRQHEQRQRQVEEHLDRKGPGDRYATAEGVDRTRAGGLVDGVVLEEAVVHPPVAAEGSGHAGHDGRQRENSPVGGEDPDEPPLAVVAEPGARSARHPRFDERSVQEEGGEEEEERHTDVEVSEEAAVVAIVEGAGEDRGVHEQHRDGGKSTEGVEEREPVGPSGAGRIARGHAAS